MCQENIEEISLHPIFPMQVSHGRQMVSFRHLLVQLFGFF